MSTDTLFERYQELQRYVDWSYADSRRVRELAPLLESHFAALIDDFYAEIERHPAARKVITGGPPQVERLKGTLREWLRNLLSGNYDSAYVAKRWRVGWRHVEIGLDQVFTNMALSRLRRGLLCVLEGEPRVSQLARRSLNTLLDLDLALIEDAYQAEHLARRQNAEAMRASLSRFEQQQELARVKERGDAALMQAQEHVLQSERLAAIGQMVAGLAHESGNALARSQACLEMLTWEVTDRPEAINLIDRIQKAHDHLQQLYEEVRGYAAPIKLAKEIWDLSYLWRGAWENLAVKRGAKVTCLQEKIDGVDLRCRVDHFRLDQVFRNLFENSLAACDDHADIVVAAKEAPLEGRPALTIAVRDKGPGLTPEQQRRIFEPFFTTKTKGTGLGMAIVKRIVEAHRGRIEVGANGPGAEILITLPRDLP